MFSVAPIRLYLVCTQRLGVCMQQAKKNMRKVRKRNILYE